MSSKNKQKIDELRDQYYALKDEMDDNWRLMWKTGKRSYLRKVQQIGDEMAEISKQISALQKTDR